MLRRLSTKFLPSGPCQSQRLKLSVTTRAPASTSDRRSEPLRRLFDEVDAGIRATLASVTLDTLVR